MIIEKEQRREKLLKYGVPSAFLSAIDNIKQFEDLEFLIKYPDSTYWYLTDILKTYEILKGYDVTPIYEGGNGDTFYVLLSSKDEVKFVFFELENDKIYTDYGRNFMLMFADLLISYYELSDEVSIETLTEYGTKMGFPKSVELFNSLNEADKNNLRETFEMNEQWRKDNIYNIL